MTPRDRLMELAERCEAATGPDRELDALIWCALNRKKYAGHNPAYQAYGGDTNPETQVEFTEPPKRTRFVTTGARLAHAKPWTASLDAAMTLASEIRHIEWCEGFVEAVVWRESDHCYYHAARAATPALALVAAALRARAATPLLDGDGHE